MKNKFYTLILMVFCCGWWTARAQDSTIAPPPPPQCSVAITYSHDSSQPAQPYIFFAQAALAGATSDSITWTVNDTIAGRGDTLIRILQPGTSTICANLVTNLGCQSQSCITILNGDTTQPPPPPQCSISFTYSHDSTQGDQSYHFFAQAAIGSATSDSITWTVNNTIAGTGDSLTRNFQPGVYSVCADLITGSGCQSQYCQTIDVTDSTAGTPPPDTTGEYVRCYPNPAFSSTNILLQLDKEALIYIRVYNSMGGEVEEKTVKGFVGMNIVSVPLGSLQMGIYYIQLQYGNQIRRSKIQKL
jgi:hypothetical protein